MEIDIPEFDPKKCIPKKDRKRLIAVAKSYAKSACPNEKQTAVRDYFLIRLDLGTGLRVMEIAALNCGDLFL
jgi:integrase